MYLVSNFKPLNSPLNVSSHLNQTQNVLKNTLNLIYNSHYLIKIYPSRSCVKQSILVHSCKIYAKVGQVQPRQAMKAEKMVEYSKITYTN